MGTPNYEPAIYWCREREAARKRVEEYKLALKLGLGGTLEGTLRISDDPIIRDWRFCNVRREDDRVTIWIKKNIREAYADHPLLWLMLCMGRQINLPTTLYALACMYPGAWPGDDEFTPENLRDALTDRAALGLKNYTGVYVISAPPGGGPKPTYTAMQVIGCLWNDRNHLAQFVTGEMRSMKRFHSMLMGYPGWGPFLAYQAIVDMRFTDIFKDAIDATSWCAAGPGTIRGLNRVYGRPVDQDLTRMKKPAVQLRAMNELRIMWPILVKESGVEMDLSDVPNVMCETDKYLRVKNGEGFPRNRYRPNLNDRTMDHAE